MIIRIYRLMVFSRQATNDPEILTPDLKNRPTGLAGNADPNRFYI
jgi:hypothetical protein